MSPTRGTTSIPKLLFRPRETGIKPWVEDGFPRFKVIKGLLTPEPRDEMVAHKQAPIAFLLKALSSPALQPIQTVFRKGEPEISRTFARPSSSLVTTSYPDMQPTIGLTKNEVYARHHRRLVALGFRGANPHRENDNLPKEVLKRFRLRHVKFGIPSERAGSGE